MEKVKIKDKKTGLITEEMKTAFNVFRSVASNEEGGFSVSTALSILSKEEKEKWHGWKDVPPGSPLEIILNAFKKHTDMPLELPFHTFFSYVSALLTNECVKVEVGDISTDGFLVSPELWTIILASSGSGKSYVAERIARNAPFKHNLNGFVSAAAFHDTLYQNEQESKANFAFIDEVAQLWKQLEQVNGPLEELKKYLLLAYGNAPLVRKTQKYGTIEVKESKLTFLGLNVYDTFIKHLTPESILDGTAQRFGFSIAKAPEDRHIKDFPRYATSAIDFQCEKAWSVFNSVERHKVYKYSEEALNTYDKLFCELYDECNVKKSQNSFYRRLTMRAHKLALIYHIITGDNTDIIKPISIMWAMRLLKTQILDTAKIIYDVSPKACDMLNSVKKIDEKLTVKNEKLKPWHIQNGIRAIKESEDAKERAKELYEAYMKIK